MGSLMPNDNERRLLVNQIKEALLLFGSRAKIYLPEAESFYKDKQELGEGIEIRLLLEENPERRVLNNLGWYNAEEKPTLVFTSCYREESPLEITQDAVIVLENSYALRVEEVNKRYLLGIWYTLKCVPWVKDRYKGEEERQRFIKGDREEVR